MASNGLKYRISFNVAQMDAIIEMCKGNIEDGIIASIYKALVLMRTKIDIDCVQPAFAILNTTQRKHANNGLSSISNEGEDEGYAIAAAGGLTREEYKEADEYGAICYARLLANNKKEFEPYEDYAAGVMHAFLKKKLTDEEWNLYLATGLILPEEQLISEAIPPLKEKDLTLPLPENNT